MRLRTFTCCLLIASLMLGCVPREEGRTRIVFAFWGSLEQQAVEEGIVEAFEAANPDVRVDLLPIGARYAEKVQAMMVGDIAPDVIMVEMSQYAEWAARGALLDLTSLVRELDAESEIMPLALDAFQQNGHYYAVPVNCCGVVMFYNKAALEKAGVDPAALTTWEDVMTAAPRLSARNGEAKAVTDFAMMMPRPVIVMWGYGVELFDNDRRPGEVTVDTPAAREAIAMLRAMDGSGYAVPPDIANDQGTYQLFRDGRVALYFDGRWRTPDFAGQTNFEWDVVPVPAGPASDVTAHGGTGLAVSRNTREAEAAKRFVRFYASREGVAPAMEGGRLTPVYRDMAFGEFLDESPPASMRVFAETMEAGASRFPLYGPGASEVNTILHRRVEQALSDPDLPADDVVEGLDVELRHWLARQQRKGLL